MRKKLKKAKEKRFLGEIKDDQKCQNFLGKHGPKHKRGWASGLFQGQVQGDRERAPPDLPLKFVPSSRPSDAQPLLCFGLPQKGQRLLTRGLPAPCTPGKGEFSPLTPVLN